MGILSNLLDLLHRPQTSNAEHGEQEGVQGICAKGQENWLIDRARAGSGHCYLLLGTGDGHYAWRAESLRKARAGTYIAAQSLCCCRVPAPPEYTLPIAECLNALLLCATYPKRVSEGVRS